MNMIRISSIALGSFLAVSLAVGSSFATPADDYIASKQAHANAIKEQAYDNVAYMRDHRDTPQVQSSISKDLSELQPAAGGPPTPAPVITKTPVANSKTDAKSKNN